MLAVSLKSRSLIFFVWLPGDATFNNGSADTAVGRLASWTSNKTIKLQMFEHSSGYEFAINFLRVAESVSLTLNLNLGRIGILSLGLVIFPLST